MQEQRNEWTTLQEMYGAAYLVDARALIALAVAAGIGTVGLDVFPVRSDQVFLAVIEARRPVVFHVLAYGYALLWFSTPF